MVLLENDAFLSELTRMFQKSRTSGSVVLTMKRYDGRTTPKAKQPKPTSGHHHHHHEEFKCLIRATLGNRKITSVINPKDVNKFQQAYANLLKGNMDGLKKRDKKTAKSKATQ